MQRRIAVIFVSRRGSLRSILAQGCLAHLDPKNYAAHACGQPGQIDRAIHPAAVAALQTAGMALPKDAPHSWNDLVRSGAPAADFVITLEPDTQPFQPRWPGQPDAALWAFPDIAAGADPHAVAPAAMQMLLALRRRLELLVSLPMRGADRAAVRSDLRDLAHLG